MLQTQHRPHANNAEEAARFYAKTFPHSAVGEVHLAPSEYPGGKEGDVLTVEFTVCGIPCIGLTDTFKHSEAFSFQIATDDQAPTATELSLHSTKPSPFDTQCQP